MGNSIKFIEPHTMIRFGELAQQACPKVLREDSLARMKTTLQARLQKMWRYKWNVFKAMTTIVTLSKKI